MTTITLTSSLRERWAKRLEELHVQNRKCTGRLRIDTRFCAIGALCDVVDPEGWTFVHHEGCEGSWRWYGGFYAPFSNTNGEEVFPVDLVTKSGIDLLNDKGATFEELAVMVRNPERVVLLTGDEASRRGIDL